MFRYLPSKKVFFVAAIAVALLLFTLLYQDAEQARIVEESKSVKALVAEANLEFPDADEDGLADWEEPLYGFDKNNPDSDGDGILDNEEKSAGRFVLALNPTDSILNNFRQSLDPNNPDNQFDPTQHLTTEPTIYENPFGVDALHIESDENHNVDEYFFYGIAALAEANSMLAEEPLFIVERWIESRDENDLDKLKSISNEAKSAAISFLEIPVPKDFVATHLEIANNLFLSAIALDDIEKTIEDPTAGFFAAANFANHQSKYLSALNLLIAMGANETTHTHE